MTQIEVAYRYAARPTEAALRALDNVREVYGIRRLRFDEKEQIVRVEYDASRFKEPWRSTDHGELLYDERGLPR